MKKIYKTKLRVPVVNEIEMSRYANILMVHQQGTDICIWYEHIPAHLQVTRKFKIIRTGDEIPEQSIYLGTALLWSGSSIYHVYELLD